MTERKKPKFRIRQWRIKLRLKRKKNQKWKRQKGRDNKTRLKFKGYARRVEIGWGNSKKKFGRINGIAPVYIQNIKQLNNLAKGSGIITAHIGKRKKAEIIKRAGELGLIILNRSKKQNAIS
jgi:large subunit ribosomal protein L32e